MPKDALDKTPSESSTVEPLPVATAGIPVPEAEPALDLVVQTEQARPSERREIVESATLVTLGNLGSSVMGMIRQIVGTGSRRTLAGPVNSALSPAQTFHAFLLS